MSSRNVKSRSGVPGLSRIPGLGALFRSTDDQVSNSELSVLLTPHIMSGEEMFPGTQPSSVAKVTLPSGAENMAPATPEDKMASAGEEKPKPSKRTHRQW